MSPVGEFSRCAYILNLKKKKKGIKHCGTRKKQQPKVEISESLLGLNQSLKAQSGERASPAILQTGS